MAKISPLMIAPPVIFAGFVLLAAVGMFRDDKDALPSALIGKTAPSVASLEQLGETELLTDELLRGDGVKLVNFWGTWCVACRAEHPTLMWISENMDTPLYGINFDDTTHRAIAYLAEEGNPFAAGGEAKTKQTKIDWGVYGAPETFVIDASGTVVLRYAGPITQRILQETIMPAIQSAQGTGS